MARKKKEEIVEEILEEVAPALKLVSLTMGATIRTGDYSNIVVSYTVEGGDIDDMQASLLKRIEHLYDSHSEDARRSKAKADVLPTITIPKEEVESPKEETPAQPEKSKHVIIAEAYLHNAKTPEAKEAVKERIKVSKNFTEEERALLLAK